MAILSLWVKDFNVLIRSIFRFEDDTQRDL